MVNIKNIIVIFVYLKITLSQTVEDRCKNECALVGYCPDNSPPSCDENAKKEEAKCLENCRKKIENKCPLRGEDGYNKKTWGNMCKCDSECHDSVCRNGKCCYQKDEKTYDYKACCNGYKNFNGRGDLGEQDSYICL